MERDEDGSILVANLGNNAVRRVTMAGAVSTVTGNGEHADSEGAAARRASIARLTWWWTRRARS
jgi:hypothetical protein